ncbi:MAG: sporulation integral membrane protein YtvI [Clostridia bacterium]|nr:sporulation integral membrane protein YtvI [Clostridia bacterium]
MDKKRTFRIFIVAIGVILGCLFVVFLPRLLVLFLPFVLAYFLAKIIDPLVRFLHKKCKIPRAIGSVFSIVLAIGVLGGIIFAVVSRLISEMRDIIEHSDEIIAKIMVQFESMRNFVADRFGVAEALDQVLANLGETVSDFAASHTVPALQGAFDVVKSIPSAILFAVAFFMATFFMSSDRRRIREGMHRALPKSMMHFVDDLMTNVFSALGAYVRAQLVLICITFCELSIGFLIIGGSVADYALLFALIISIIDAIPILGTGVVLIPWGLFSLLSGDTRLGIMLIVLYLICLAVRQLTEPRLVAHQIGLHPLLILMVMYVGFQFFGFLGMILGPVLALCIKQIYAGGLFTKIGRYIRGDAPAENKE